MGGFPHPRDCQKCICPGGYAGKRCTERPSSGCGDTIKASSNWTRLENTVGLGRDEQEDFETCHYWIESPEGTEIEVKLVNFTKGLSVDGCSYAGVEIKTNKDQTLTGYRTSKRDLFGPSLRVLFANMEGCRCIGEELKLHNYLVLCNYSSPAAGLDERD
ncbi:hypothetical protein COOONC_15192 [Cooperia oncophora]